MKINYIGALLIALATTKSCSLGELSDLQKYAGSLLEFSEKIENVSYPDYSSVYQSYFGGFFFDLLKSIGLYPHQAWSVKEHHQYINKMSELLQKRGVKKEVSLELTEPSQFYIWGNLYGAFHSLVRTLSELKKQGVINENMVIQDRNTYFVFNGNAIDLSPYSLAILTAIGNLIESNPTQVFYLQGLHEHNNFWHDHSLFQEISERVINVAEKKKMLEDVSAFFALLPQKLLVAFKDEPDKFIIIEQGDIQDESSLDIESIFNKKPLAVINSIDPLKGKVVHKGIVLQAQELGVTTWGVFSSPISLFKQYAGFKYDAFARLDAVKPLQDSVITLYNQSAEKPEEFQPVVSYNVASGSQKNGGKGLNKKPIVIGSSISLVSGVPILGKKTKLGMDIAINRANKEGGINGHAIKLITINDSYIPYLARRNVAKLKEQADVILLPVGSPTLASYLDYVKANSVLVMFPITGGPQFRDPNLTGVVHFRASYADEVKALIAYLIKETGARNFAFFYQNDAYGLGPFKAAQEVLKAHGIDKWFELPYARASVRFDDQVAKLKEYQPDAIGFFSAASATEEFIRQLGIDMLANKKLFGISFLASHSFRNFVEKHGLEFLFGSVVPNPFTSELEIVKEYRKEMDEHGEPYDVYSLEGYITTKILLEILKTVPEPISSDKIRLAFEALDSFEYKGLTLTFDHSARSMAKYVWIETAKDKPWRRYDIDELEREQKELEEKAEAEKKVKEEQAKEQKATEKQNEEQAEQKAEAKNNNDKKEGKP